MTREALQERVAAVRARVGAAASGRWAVMLDGPRGDGEPWQAFREAAPGLTIGTSDHTEPLCRVSGYPRYPRANADLIANAPSDLTFLLDTVEALLKDEERLLQFAGAALNERRAHAGCDWYGGDLQDVMVASGLIVAKNVTERCGDACVCEELGAFPCSCLFPTELGKRASKSSQGDHS